MLEFQQFAQALGHMLEIDTIPAMAMTTKLDEDLGVDSLGLFRIGLALENLTDELIFFDEIEVPTTVGDLYDLYRRFLCD